jgi:hypothetical protein
MIRQAPQRPAMSVRRRTCSLSALLAAAICSACISAPEEHLIPSGYVGDVFIVVRHAKGEPPRRDGISRVYSIPSSGILITQDRMSPGWHIAKFYYLSRDGSRTRLPVESSPVEDSPANRSDSRPFVWFEHDVYQNRACEELQYRQYYVGTRADLLSRAPTRDEERFMNFMNESFPCS